MFKHTAAQCTSKEDHLQVKKCLVRFLSMGRRTEVVA